MNNIIIKDQKAHSRSSHAILKPWHCFHCACLMSLYVLAHDQIISITLLQAVLGSRTFCGCFFVKNSGLVFALLLLMSDVHLVVWSSSNCGL